MQFLAACRLPPSCDAFLLRSLAAHVDGLTLRRFSMSALREAGPLAALLAALCMITPIPLPAPTREPGEADEEVRERMRKKALYNRFTQPSGAAAEMGPFDDI